MNDQAHPPHPPSDDGGDGSSGAADDAASPPACRSCGARSVPPHRYCTACGRRVDDPDEQASTASDDADDDRAAVTTELTVADTEAASGTRQPQDRVPPASGLPATRRCGSCGAVNVHHRVLCGACGMDLDGDDIATVAPSGEAALVAVDRPLAGSGAVSRRGVGWWWLWVAVVAVGSVVATLVIGGVGPFEEGPAALDPVAFPHERYPDQPQRLELSSVATLTTREPSGERSFSPQLMVDGDTATAWHGDADALPDTTREKLDLHLQRPAWVTDLVVANGDQADAEGYVAAGRLHRVDLQFDGGQVVRATLLDIGSQLQRVHLDEPLLTTAVRIEVAEALAGEQHRGPAVSQVEVRGVPAADDDVALAEQRAEQLPATGTVTLTSGRPELPLPGRLGG